MRSKKRIAVLELQVEYLAHYLDLLSDQIILLLEDYDKRNQQPAPDMDAGKWYKKS